MARHDAGSGGGRKAPPFDDSWSPAISRSGGPLYLAIADAMEADIASGALPAGTRLPSQRALAARLGVDFTTITRAYTEARRRGLIDGKVGQGTWVLASPAGHSLALAGATPRGGARQPAKPHPRPRPQTGQPEGAPERIPRRAPERPPGRSGLVDMSMNLPPPVGDSNLAARMWDSVAATGRDGGADLMMRYQEPGGGAQDREAGAAWLAPRLPGVDPARVLACPGAQSALLAACHAICAAGDAIAAGTLVYPGLIAATKVLGLRLLPIAMDSEGLLPEAFEAACKTQAPRALYCNPTLSSPTTRTLSLQRRQALIAIAAAHNVTIIEDDAYGALAPDAPPPLACLAPEQVIHIAGMAKCLAPALRVAWVATPDIRGATRLGAAIGATALMASPLTVAIAATWIRNGVADAVRDAIRAETAARVTLARRILPAACVTADSNAFHLWLDAPAPWRGVDLAARLRVAGVAAVPSEAFAIGPAPRQALRLGLGVPARRDDLERGLHIAADLLAREPEFAHGVV